MRFSNAHVYNSVADKRRLSSGLHAPIFSVVMRSSDTPRQLECHAFVCHSPEDAIVIAATLYQSLMSHMGGGSGNGVGGGSGGARDGRGHGKKIRKPRNENGVSCISIASSSVGGGGGGANRFGSITPMSLRQLEAFKTTSSLYPPRPPRKKRTASSSISGHSSGGGHSDRTASRSDECQRRNGAGYGEDGKKKSHKTKRAPPIPNSVEGRHTKNRQTASTAQSNLDYQSKDPYGGDIFTRVAIPRSGSFLNTSGLTRYKSRATRRPTGSSKHGGSNVGGGGGGGGGGG